MLIVYYTSESVTATEARHSPRHLLCEAAAAAAAAIDCSSSIGIQPVRVCFFSTFRNAYFEKKIQNYFSQGIFFKGFKKMTLGKSLPFYFTIVLFYYY